MEVRSQSERDDLPRPSRPTANPPPPPGDKEPLELGEPKGVNVYHPNRWADRLKLLAAGPMYWHLDCKGYVRTVICECWRRGRTSGWAVGHLPCPEEFDEDAFLDSFCGDDMTLYKRMRTFPSDRMAESWTWFAHLIFGQSSRVVMREVQRGTRSLVSQ